MVYGTHLIGPLHRHQSMKVRIRGEVLPPIEVIRSATSYAAELFNMVGEIGTVAVGAHTELLAFDGDPLRELGLLQVPAKLSLIMKDGDIYRNAITN